MRDHFAQLLGIENALDNPNELLAYSYDASGKQGRARIVLFPKTLEHLHKILIYANRTNIPVTTRGLGANPMGMAVPDNSIVIDMAHFDRIHTVNLNEGWVVVEPGVVLSDLQAVLKPHGFTFPIDPESRNVATVGGLLAIDQMDRRSIRNGRLSEHVLELEVLDGTGKHYPDARKDFLGMEGTCAIITKAKIRIIPPIEQTTTDLLAYAQLHDLLAKSEEKMEDLSVTSLEYLNPIMSELQGLAKKHHLLVEYKSDAGEIVDPEAQQRIWKGREKAWSLATRNGHGIIEDCKASFDQLYDILTWCEERGLPAVAHIADGVVHPFFADDDKDDYYEFLKDLGAEVAGQFGYGLLKKKYVPKAKRELLKKLKDEYDYNDILGRGKVHDYA